MCTSDCSCVVVPAPLCAGVHDSGVPSKSIPLPAAADGSTEDGPAAAGDGSPATVGTATSQRGEFTQFPLGCKLGLELPFLKTNVLLQ